MSEPANPLARLEAAHRMLAEARTVDELKDVRNVAEAARLYAVARKLGLESENDAAEIRLRSERRLGELLAEMPKRDGGDAMKAHSDPTREVPPKLADLGITYDESSRWQQIAKLPEPEFERHIAETRGEGRPLTTARVVDLARNGFDPTTLPPMKLSHAQNAFYAIPKLASYLDVEPSEVADAAEHDNRLDADVDFFRAIDQWLQAVIREIDGRRSQRLRLVQGDSR